MRHSYGYSYCNSPLIQCSTLTAISLIFTELYGCTIDPDPMRHSLDFIFTGYVLCLHQSLPGYLKDNTWTLVWTISDTVSPSSQQWFDFRVGCACCEAASDLSFVVAGRVCEHVLQSISLSQEETHFLVTPMDCRKVLQQHKKALKSNRNLLLDTDNISEGRG